MDMAITVIQVLMGFLAIVGGLAKLTLPYAQYSNTLAWAQDFKPGHILLLGVLEMSGGIGLIVPLFLPSITLLTPLAAVGTALYLAGAIATHLRRSEYLHMVGILVFFLAPALFVAYGTLVRLAV